MSYNQNKTSTAAEGDIFKQLLHKYFPFWPLYLLLVIMFLGLAYFFGKWTTPVYEAYSSVIIKDETKGLNESEMLQDLNLFRGKKIVENEIEILRSNSFISNVVENLALYAEVYREEKFKSIPAYTSSPIKLKFKDPSRIRVEEKIPFLFDREKRTVTIGENTYPINQWIQTKWGELSFTPNYKYSGDTLKGKLHFLLTPPEVVQAVLQKKIKVVPASKLATVINLSIKDATRERAEDILNELVKVYTEAEIEDKNLRAANTVAMVESRIRNIAGQLDSVENAIQKYRSNAGVIDISEQGKQYLSNVGEYDRQVEQIKNQISILDEVERFVLTKDASNSIVPSAIGVNDPMLNQLLDKLNDYQMQYEKLKRTTGENSPILISITDQIDQLKPGILENVRNQKINLNITKNNFSSTGSRYSAMLSSIPQKERQLIEISRQQSIKNQLYGFLLEKREEAALSFTSNNKGDTRIIDKAYSSVLPVSPNKFILYLAAIVFGIGIGIIYVSLKEGLNSIVLFRTELEKMIGVPVMSEIMQNSTREPFVMMQDNSRVNGQIKSLRNILYFGANENQSRKLIVTSSQKQDGKSFLAANLAISLAKTGAKVLLVDLDFKNKKITGLFNLEKGNGISDFLRRNAGLETLTFPFADLPALHIMPVGQFSDGGSELLIGNNFELLVKELESRFDYLIFSGPAFNEDVNIQAISHSTDTTLFVVRQGITKKSNLSMLINNQHIASLKNPVFVFNGVKGRGWGIKMFGNGFGFGNNPRT